VHAEITTIFWYGVGYYSDARITTGYAQSKFRYLDETPIGSHDVTILKGSIRDKINYCNPANLFVVRFVKQSHLESIYLLLSAAD
jgi:hypothetical protein